MKKRFIVRLENKFEISERVERWIETLSDELLPVEVTIKPYKKNRSLEQNDFYWTVITLISAETGYSKDEIHDLMRYKFLGLQSKDISGQKIEYLPSTTKLKIGEMADYITQCEAWAAEMGIRLPYREKNV